MSLKKILRTDDLPKRTRDDRVDQGPYVFVSTNRPMAMNKDGYIARYGTEEEKSELVKAIKTRRARLPRWTYLACPSCNWKMKTPFGDSDIEKRERPPYCLRCNIYGYTDGAVMREMTAKEIKIYEKETAERETRERERHFKAAFYQENEDRQRRGLKPLSESEFKERRRREFAQVTGEAWRGKK